MYVAVCNDVVFWVIRNARLHVKNTVRANDEDRKKFWNVGARGDFRQDTEVKVISNEGIFGLMKNE